jgi:hypothetical protein
MTGHGVRAAGDSADTLARRTFYITLIGCVAFSLAVFLFVLS